MRRIARPLMFLMLTALAACSFASDRHPRLLLSADDVAELSQTWQASPTFAGSLARTRSRIDSYFATPPDVPTPRDAGGGYTHEQHKRNARAIYDAGTLYQWTGDATYVKNAQSLLLAYAKLYPTLGEHPQKKEQSPGRLFWQSLNEAVWLVYAIQGYDAIYDAIDAEQRAVIENGLLRPLTSFLSVESPQTFDKIHNHGTWAVAAVGMTGYVLNDEKLVGMALSGLNQNGSTGFLRQLDELFSPDGYYMEGPYYQRYALMPFVVFAKSIDRNDPERKIFEHRDGILLKAINTAIQLSYAGKFFPLNDSIKDKGLDTIELDYAISIAYGLDGDTSLLSLISKGSQVVLTGDGLRMAAALDAGKASPFPFKSMRLRDGADGQQGSLSIMRSGAETGHAAVVFKSTSQGMGHGHFDRLSWLYYDNDKEVVSDYGAARFLNVVQKNGGHYLRENKTWAKQTVAHNALVVDETSHFDGALKNAERSSPQSLFFEAGASEQIAAATETEAYPGVVMTRTLALLKHEAFEHAIVLDVLRVKSSKRHQYDLPLYYHGQLVDVSLPMKVSTDRLLPLGKDNGYQHLWVRARGEVAKKEALSVTWLLDNRFYTYTTLGSKGSQLVLTEVGANDPDFNLRHEPGIMLRVADTANHTFVSVLESHGEYNGAREFTKRSGSQIKTLRHFSEGGIDLVHIETTNGQQLNFALSYDANPDSEHAIATPTGRFAWQGFYSLFEGPGQ